MLLVLAFSIGILCVSGTTHDTKKGPPMVKFSNFKNMHSNKIIINPAYKYLPVAYSNPPGKEMHGGLLELRKGDDFEFTQWYDGFMYVLQGTLKLEDKAQGSSFNLEKGDLVKVSMGSVLRIVYNCKGDPVRLYWAANIYGPEVSFMLNSQIKNHQKIKIQRNMPSYLGKMPLLPNDQKSESYLQDFMKVDREPGRELAVGLYELRKGPALDYTYEYEEFKYIISGKFSLTDGTGQKVDANAGDLMYFPKGCAVNFKSGQDDTLGLYVGQRLAGTA